MRKCFVIFLLVLTSPMFAATIAITSVTVRSDGWSADVILTGQAGEAGSEVYDYNFGTDNDPTDAKVVFTVTSQGYNAAGALGTIERTVYGTQTIRKPYPDNADLDETDSGGNLSIRMALSDFIYDDDQVGGGSSGTDPTVTIAAGWVTNGADSTILNTDIAVTNDSTVDYPRVIGNWAWPGYEQAATNHVVECVAFHRFAQDGKQVACVKFDAEDESANSAAQQTTTEMTISGRGDPLAVLVYSATIPVSALTQGEVVTVDFIAYPWVGDADSILDTGDAVNSPPSPLYTSTNFFCDKTGAFGTTVAYVDGVGAGSPAADDIANDPCAKANPFETIEDASTAISAYNNANHGGRANCEAGIIYLEEGSHEWTGGADGAGTVAKTWLTITRASGAAKAAVIIDDESDAGLDNKSLGDRLKFFDITMDFDGSALNFGLYQVDIAWIDNCTFDDGTAAAFFATSPSFIYLTRNTITELKQGLRASGVDVTSFAVVRGNTISGVGAAHKSFVFIGNIYTHNGQTEVWQDKAAGDNAPTRDNWVMAYNFFSGWTGEVLSAGDFVTKPHGGAFVQNVVEAKSGSFALMSIGGAGAIDIVDNILYFYNTTIGNRVLMAYNDIGEVAINYTNWAYKNNLDEDYNIKTDITVTADPNRVGNWANVYGVGFESNFFRSATVDTTEFNGLYSLSEDPYASLDFVLDASGSGTGDGGGDYHLESTATKAIGRSAEILLPFDIEGNERFIDSPTSGGAVGAYEFGGGTASYYYQRQLQ